MGKVEALFGIVFVLTILFGAALFGVISFDVAQVTTDTQKEIITPVMTTEIILDGVSVETTGSGEVVEYDPSLEMQYVYIQSQNINGNFAELNEIQERMYDVAEDYDPIEYDMLQEQVDNERYYAKNFNN